MKKVLLATTLLVATASVAAADVRISGFARFGLDYNQDNDRVRNANGTLGALNGQSETSLTSRLRLQFDMSAETDGGVAFGARVRAQTENRDQFGGGTSNGGTGTAVITAPRMWVTYSGFTLSVGNILGAFDNTPGQYLETRTADIGVDGAGFNSLVTNVNGEAFNWDSFSSGGGGVNGIEVLYSAGAFNGHISYSQQNGILPTPAPITGTSAVDRQRTAVSASYTFGDWTAAIGYQDSNHRFEDKLLVTLQGDLGQFGVRLAYADNDGVDKYGLYGNMDIGAASSLVAYVTNEDAVSQADVTAGRNDNRDGSIGAACTTTCNGGEGTGYGIHYSYDLGGGASFEAGYRRASNDNNTLQAGVYFSF